jgi:hypothetical protein
MSEQALRLGVETDTDYHGMHRVSCSEWPALVRGATYL